MTPEANSLISSQTRLIQVRDLLDKVAVGHYAAHGPLGSVWPMRAARPDTFRQPCHVTDTSLRHPQALVYGLY